MDPKFKESQINKKIKSIETLNYLHPHVLQACASLGLRVSQLQPRRKEEFEDTIAEIQELRFQHFESKRKGFLRSVAEYLLTNRLKLSSTGISEPTVSNLPIASPSEQAVHRATYDEKKQMVDKNLAEIKKRERQKRSELEKKLNIEKNPGNILSEERIRRGIKRDEKISRIKEERLEEIRERELKETRRTRNLSKNTERHIKVMPSPSKQSFKLESLTAENQDIDEKLNNIYEKLQMSEIRHQEYLKTKFTHSSNLNKAAEFKKNMQVFEEDGVLHKIQKLKDSFDKSQKLKLKILNQEKEKLSKRMTEWEHRRQLDNSKAEETARKLEKEAIIKERKIKKIRKNLQYEMMKKGRIVAEKNKLKSMDAQETIMRNQKLFNEKRKSLLEKMAERYLTRNSSTDTFIKPISLPKQHNM